ncbi:MAG: tryptophan synthase subunit alpha [Acidimicrobiia bacterium]|nr:tryptophan synthase subunit alpha [Acidimicrobiia bacterium]
MDGLVLEKHLRSRRDEGRKLLVPYLTGGLDDEWPDLLRALADAGADAIEVGLPFSDPMMDGPTIQEASSRALARGATPPSVLDELAHVDAGVPLVVMTYYNLCYHAGHQRFASWLVEAGVSGAILADLPLEELGPWAEVADSAGVATVLLAAPTGSDDRLRRVCERSRGFVYSVSLLGVTGERATLASTALDIARRLKALTDRPVLSGVGISNAEQAVEACQVADGVVMGSALLRRRLQGASVEEVAALVADVRTAIDAS